MHARLLILFILIYYFFFIFFSFIIFFMVHGVAYNMVHCNVPGEGGMVNGERCMVIYLLHLVCCKFLEC